MTKCVIRFKLERHQSSSHRVVSPHHRMHTQQEGSRKKREAGEEKELSISF